MIRSNFVTRNCIIDVLQLGFFDLSFCGGRFDTNKLSIANLTKGTFSPIDRTTGEPIMIGNTADVEQTLYQVLNGTSFISKSSIST